ncbi:MAG: HepT-like ribonuclease domain-containing protein [Chloroflexota bacterium]|nr:HepT-like ribonuclease domain-containing protein [Chloroflexota bacterium]
MRNLRNRLIHEYLEVNLDIVWRIIEQDLPSLRQAAEKMLKDADG